jgi:hypothetical protein
MNDKTLEDQTSAIEKRKRWNFIARFFLSGVIFFVFFVLLYVLFYGELVNDTYRDIINILIGTYVAILTKTTDYWFKEKDDPEHKELETLNANGNNALL